MRGYLRFALWAGAAIALLDAGADPEGTESANPLSSATASSVSPPQPKGDPE